MFVYGNLIAFISFLAACSYIEVHANGAGELWVLVVLWIIFGNFTGEDKPIIKIERTEK